MYLQIFSEILYVKQAITEKSKISQKYIDLFHSYDYCYHHVCFTTDKLSYLDESFDTPQTANEKAANEYAENSTFLPFQRTTFYHTFRTCFLQLSARKGHVQRSQSTGSQSFATNICTSDRVTHNPRRSKTRVLLVSSTDTVCSG